MNSGSDWPLRIFSFIVLQIRGDMIFYLVCLPMHSFIYETSHPARFVRHYASCSVLCVKYTCFGKQACNFLPFKNKLILKSCADILSIFFFSGFFSFFFRVLKFRVGETSLRLALGLASLAH